MTQDELLAIGCKCYPHRTHKGELIYYLEYEGIYLAARFVNGVFFYAEITDSFYADTRELEIELKNVTKIEQFKQLYTLLTGKEATK